MYNAIYTGMFKLHYYRAFLYRNRETLKMTSTNQLKIPIEYQRFSSKFPISNAKKNVE